MTTSHICRILNEIEEYGVQDNGIYNAIILRQDAFFRGDIALFDLMGVDLTYSKAYGSAKRYWNQDYDENTIIEVLFQGKLKLANVQKAQKQNTNIKQFENIT